ncbi:membrane protein insertase YidC [Enterococcus sp. AZ102]|uniref:membrane protein insertase YidC n=1 Tax=Enterococcus sp. AZ102 TaxID=2774865 RepID=UPI003F2279B3
MKNKKTWFLASGLFTLLFFLSGCVKTIEQNGTRVPDPDGFIYKTLVVPLGGFLTYLAENFNWGFGLAIIIVTIIVRIILLPMGISQSKKAMVQAEKMQYLKPQIDIAQANMKKATTKEDQMQAQMQMQQVYKENNVSMFGGIGCLPLLIQMPIFSALYFTVSYTQGINSASFLGIDLGKSSLILVILAGLSYVGQGYLSLIGVPEEQKKTMRSMLIVSPLMIVFISFSAPAGVTLYWVVGGIFSCVQTFITNVLMKPRIKQKIAAEMEKNPPKIVVTPTVKDVTPDQAAPKAKAKPINAPKNGRNAGKQQKRK